MCAGIHEIKFVYSKNFYGDWESDKAYIKFITLVGSLPNGVRGSLMTCMVLDRPSFYFPLADPCPPPKHVPLNVRLLHLLACCCVCR